MNVFISVYSFSTHWILLHFLHSIKNKWDVCILFQELNLDLHICFSHTWLCDVTRDRKSAGIMRMCLQTSWAQRSHVLFYLFFYGWFSWKTHLNYKLKHLKGVSHVIMGLIGRRRRVLHQGHSDVFKPWYQNTRCVIDVHVCHAHTLIYCDNINTWNSSVLTSQMPLYPHWWSFLRNIIDQFCMFCLSDMESAERLKPSSAGQTSVRSKEKPRDSSPTTNSKKGKL